MSSRGADRSYGEHAVAEKEKQERWDWRSKVQECVEACNIELARGDDRNYLHVLNILHDYLYPLVVNADRTNDLDHYHMELVDDDDYDWYWTAVNTLLDRYDEYYAALSAGETADAVERHLMREQNALPICEAARRRTERAFRSVEAICEAEGIVSGKMSASSVARGFAVELGDHMQPFDMDLGEEVRIVDDDKGSLKTLFAGDTGEGKSASRFSEAEDRYNAGRKLVEVADFKTGENTVQDAPQGQEALRDIRREHGLPETFEESDDYDNPELEIYIPLTPNLAEYDLPYNVEEEEFVPNVFTIPLCDIPMDVMVAMLSADATQQQETEIRQAYQDVSLEKDDFSLSDIADEVKARDTLDDRFRERVVRTLFSLEKMGFIRTRDDPHALDLEAILRDRETITSFTQMTMRTKTAKLMVVLALLGMIRDVCDNTHDLPKITLGIGELHKIAPHTNRESFDRNAGDIQDTLGTLLGEIFRENRHTGLEILCDTQTIGDIKKNVRREFNRAVVFSPSSIYNVVGEMKSVRNEVAEKCINSMRTKAGYAAVVGNAEPINEHKSIDYLSPVKYVPASWHHFDSDDYDGDGFDFRVEYFDEEELRNPQEVGVEWKLTTENAIDKDELTVDGVDAEDDPRGYFSQNCLTVTGDPSDDVEKAVVRECYDKLREEKDLPEYTDNTFGKKLKKKLPDMDDSKRRGSYVYTNIQLTEYGRSILYG